MLFSETTTALSQDQDILTVSQNGHPITFIQTLTLWAESPAFRKFYWQTLIELGGEGCFWEHPRLTEASAEEPYECVITRTDGFARFTATPDRFRAKMEPDTNVSAFPNLGKDGLLIIPNEPDEGADVNCRDLIAFCRTAPESWLHDYWERIGRKALKALADNSPRQFLSTHGFGVLWLHVRLEERPKYYRYRAYR